MNVANRTRIRRLKIPVQGRSERAVGVERNMLAVFHDWLTLDGDADVGMPVSEDNRVPFPSTAKEQSLRIRLARIAA
jgi:hypothetical protein